MASASKITILVINYISLTGLLICSLASIFLSDKRKKMLFLSLVFLFTGILSFVYYSAILVFVIWIMMIFFFILLYLFIMQIEFFVNPKQFPVGEDTEDSIPGKILNTIISLIICAGTGYLIYRYTVIFLKGIKILEGSENILIAGWSDISRQIFTDYGLILIIITASLFMTFLWFMVVGVRKK